MILELEKNKSYPVELFPGEDIVPAKYIDIHKGDYLFQCTDGDYLIVRKDWATIENKVITHSTVSSFSILKIKPEMLKNKNDN